MHMHEKFLLKLLSPYLDRVELSQNEKGARDRAMRNASCLITPLIDRLSSTARIMSRSTKEQFAPFVAEARAIIAEGKAEMEEKHQEKLKEVEARADARVKALEEELAKEKEERAKTQEERAKVQEERAKMREEIEASRKQVAAMQEEVKKLIDLDARRDASFDKSKVRVTASLHVKGIH